MKHWNFKQWNTAAGWGVFAIALITYLSTIEPNFSFWDCGEYISSSIKLQVTHAPGAAFFQLMGALFAILAFGNPLHYSMVINSMSALCSALTILFLFWTITHLVRYLFHKKSDEVTSREQLIILLSGAVGALAFAFSDTFWFSAVEGEVYAMSSMFIAAIVWLITKWENEAYSKDNERWIILIFFLVGLSVGVHMMCMLCVPCICLVYYAQKYKFTWKSFIIANLITLGVLGIVFKGIFPFIMTVFGKTEIFFVNGWGMPFHSGTIIAFLLLILVGYILIHYSRKSKSHIFQTAALSVIYMVIGFSCWLVIPIRANANPPINLNNPDNAIGMLDYYNRVQYGDWPTLYGQNYTAYLDWNGLEKNEDGSLKTVKTSDIYEKDEKTGRYIDLGDRFDYVYNPAQVSFLPRMFAQDKSVISNYISMYGAPDFTFNDNDEDLANSQEAHQYYQELRKKYDDKTITVDDYYQAKKYHLINVKKPSLWTNLDYFITFQNNYYFTRYLLWNFAGRQNDLEGSMENTKGNWISGIPILDNYLYGDQSTLPAKYRDSSRVYFFFLPLILGLLGFFFQLDKDFKRFYAFLSLFVLTSFGIVFYTGVKPFEPRERDYAMVGSFYAFAIWIGIGAAAVLYFVKKQIKSRTKTPLAATGALLLLIPAMMGFQNYNSHDRSQWYTSYDYAYSTLNDLPKNDILFTYGDNDTYPLWAIQETQNFRDDVKVINYELLPTPWNIDQVKRRTYNAMPVPHSLNHEDYRDGTNEQIYLMTPDDWKSIIQTLKENQIPETSIAGFQKYITQDSMTLKDAMAFLKKDSPQKDFVRRYVFGENKYKRFNILPVNKFILPVNVENAVKTGIIKAKDAPLAVKQITIKYDESTLFKGDLMMMDILAHFDWKRPINFSSGGIGSPQSVFYLNDYLQYDGFSYRLVPIKTKGDDQGNIGRVDADDLYHIIKGFRWGNFKDPNVHYNETSTSNIIGYRNSASRDAIALAEKGERKKALEILDLASKEIPDTIYNDPRTLSSMIYAYIVAGDEKKGLEIADRLKKNILAEYDYYNSLSPRDQRLEKSPMTVQPLLYSLVVSSVTDAYKKIGKKDKAYDYLVSSIKTIDVRFDKFIKHLKTLDKEQAYHESENVQKITPFYQYLFQVMDNYDTTYAKDKSAEITNAVIRATE